MTVINGVEVAVHTCKECGSSQLWLFRGQNGEGYKIVCAGCKAEQRELINELNLPYLWRHLEVKDVR